jgi:hypothetical protein
VTLPIDQGVSVNVLLIGAARSGTTALIEELRRHPDVHATDPKETHFFAYAGASPSSAGPGDDQMIGRSLVADPMTLARMVAPGRERPVRIEGSVSTLYRHEVSIPNIEKYAAPQTKMLVLLRSPAERAYSSYLYLVARGHETAPTFEEALKQEDERVAAGWHHLWHYRAMSRYGPQLQAFVERFGRERIFLGLHEDYVREPEPFLRSVLAFLELDPALLPVDRVGDVNRGGVPRFAAARLANALVRRSVRIERTIKRVAPRQLRERARTTSLLRPEMASSTRALLTSDFEADIEAVEQLMGRRLEHWR